jgi:hypothetical protein
MTLGEALSQIPDPRARNRQYPLWGLLALILVAFLSRVDSLRDVARFTRTNPRGGPGEGPGSGREAPPGKRQGEKPPGQAGGGTPPDAGLEAP